MSQHPNSDYVAMRCDVCRTVPNKDLKCLCGRTAWKKPERRPDTAREASLRKAILALQAQLHQQEASARDAVAVGFQYSGAKELADEWKAASDSAMAIVADYRKRAGVKP